MLIEYREPASFSLVAIVLQSDRDSFGNAVIHLVFFIQTKCSLSIQNFSGSVRQRLAPSFMSHKTCPKSHHEI